MLGAIFFMTTFVAVARGAVVSSDVYAHTLRPTLVDELGDNNPLTCLTGHSVKQASQVTVWVPVTTAESSVTVTVNTSSSSTPLTGPEAGCVAPADRANNVLDVTVKTADSAEDPGCPFCGSYSPCVLSGVATSSESTWDCACGAGTCPQVKVTVMPAAQSAGVTLELCDIQVEDLS